MIRIISLALAILLAGCVSTYMKQFVGKDIHEVMIADGPPIHSFDLPDGRRAFQWRMGAGSATPFLGTVYYSEGCVVTYIAKKQGEAWIVEDINYPDRLVC